jgi:hypothetical protein
VYIGRVDIHLYAFVFAHQKKNSNTTISSIDSKNEYRL